MKKIVSIMAAVSMLAAVSSTVSAANNEPTVYVNGSEIFFADQAAVIVDDRTMVPARGVFEAMGADVEWNGEEKEVIVESDDHNTIVRLNIDNTVMTVSDTSNAMANLFTGQENDVPRTKITLDVPPQLMNDRTMIPLRAISEALNADVQWDNASYSVNITTKDAPTDKSELPGYYLTTESGAVAGENVDIYVNLRNIPDSTYVSSVTATIKYNPEDFEFVSTALVNGEDVVENAMGANNPKFRQGLLKSAFVTIDADAAAKTDGKVLKVTFKSLTGKSGEFSLSNGYHTKLGYNTSLYVEYTDSSNETVEYDGDSFDVDTNAITVPEGTAAPAEVQEAEEATEDDNAAADDQTMDSTDDGSTEAPVEE